MALFHAHTPTFTVPAQKQPDGSIRNRATGPSTADINDATNQGYYGFVYDYTNTGTVGADGKTEVVVAATPYDAQAKVYIYNAS